MASYTLEQLSGWVREGASRAQNTGNQLQQARSEIQRCANGIASLTERKNKVEVAISNHRSQIAALEAQLSNMDDEEDDGSAAAIRSQISMLQGQLAQYENLWRELVQGIQQMRAELKSRQEEARVCTAKLEQLDMTLDAINDGFTEHFQESVTAKETFSKLAGGRFGAADASAKVAVMQERINVCMAFQNQIRSIQAWIRQLLDTGEDREKELTLGRSR